MRMSLWMIHVVMSILERFNHLPDNRAGFKQSMCTMPATLVAPTLSFVFKYFLMYKLHYKVSLPGGL